MTISIIIAVKTWQKNLEECVGKCRELDYPDFEIIILPDLELGTATFLSSALALTATVPIKIVPTGPLSPAQKRDVALNYANGEILAFIDDDAYPEKDWLKNAVKNFSEPQVAAVGGPAVTPPSDSLRQQASGLVYSSLLVSGRHSRRYLPKQRSAVDDYPSCNFLVRKSVLQEVGGFKTNFWPGEDTKLCLEIIRGLKKKIIYDPQVLVYHHRRPLFAAHLKQIKSYALHRGYFVKRYPQTSRKISYFIPSIFLAFLLVGSIFFLFSAWIRTVYSAAILLYIFLVFIYNIHKEIRLIPLVFCGVVSTHLVYGLYFLKGLLSRRLSEEERQ